MAPMHSQSSAKPPVVAWAHRLGAVLAGLALAACAGAQPRTSPRPTTTTTAAAEPSPRPCPSAVVVLRDRVFIVEGERAEEVAPDLAPVRVRAGASSCAPNTTLELYVDQQSPARTTARQIALASRPVWMRQIAVSTAMRTYESSSALGSFARPAPAPVDFSRDSVVAARVVVAEHLVCNDRFMGPRLHDRSGPPAEDRRAVDTSPRWLGARDVVITSVGPLRVVRLLSRHVERCHPQQGCGCDRQTAYAFTAVPRSSLPILLRER
jgi:hypothetical protein